MGNGFADVVTRYMPQISVAAPVFILAMAAVIFLLLLIVPIAPSLTAIFVPTIIPIAVNAGIAPQLVVILCSVCIACGYILPMDAVYLLTYSKGYYKIKNMSKVALCIITIAAFLCATVGCLIGWMQHLV